jgi:hypothetical protein
LSWHPAPDQGVAVMTIPEKLDSHRQKYRVTEKEKALP